MKTSIGFIGGGRMTRIIMQGFQNKSVKFKSVLVYDPNPESQERLKNDFPEIVVAKTPLEAAQAKVIIIAVHPPVVLETLKQISAKVNEETFVVSLAPKVTIENMESVVKTANIIRMIPNATSYINKGYNPVVFHHAMLKKEQKQVLKIFKPLGKIIKTQEHKLESYAIVSAMLPTYFWFQWRELEKIGNNTGLSPEEAKKAVKSSLLKAIKLYFDSGLTPEEVMDLIPVKPIGENEEEIKSLLNNKLLGLFEKIKPYH